MNIEQVMNKIVHTCRASDSLRFPAQLMWEHDVGCVPVVDEEGRPVSMVTDRDLLMCTYFTGKSLEDQTVSQAMSKELHVIHVGHSIQSASALMRAKQVRRLPVVDAAGKLAGIVSVNDLALAGGKGRVVNPEELTAMLASICQPRRSATQV